MLQEGNKINMRATEGHAVYRPAKKNINIEVLGCILTLLFVYIKPLDQKQVLSQVIWQLVVQTNSLHC